MRYLDPKNDLVFKKVFSRARLLKSFLNALLPLAEPVESLEYLQAELVPEIPGMKHSGDGGGLEAGGHAHRRTNRRGFRSGA